MDSLFWFLLLMLCFLLSLGADMFVSITMKKYAKEPNASDMTGNDCARFLLEQSGLTHVLVYDAPGKNNGHYDPQAESITLAHNLYDSNSLTAIGIAAHECGHAQQHYDESSLFQFRMKMVPIVNFGSRAAGPILVAGLAIRYIEPLVNLGILCFALVVLFQLVTLPLEIDASRRALALLRENELVEEYDYKKIRTILIAAALTYVASTLTAIVQLLRIMATYGGNGKKRR